MSLSEAHISPKKLVHSELLLCYHCLTAMKRKKYALIFVCLLLVGSLFGLWRWSGDGLIGYGGPKLGADGKTDYAGYLNTKLEKMPSYARECFLYEYVEGLDAQALADVFAQQRKLKADLREQVASILAMRWGETNPQAGWNAICEISPFPEKAARSLLVGWGARDFNAARQAVDQMENMDRRNKLAGELFKAQAKVNPQEAAQASIAEIYKKKDPALTDILEIWAGTDRSGAIAFALQNDRANRLRGIFTNWISQDKEAAFASLAAMDAKQRDEAVGAILVNDFFMRFNSSEVRALLEKFPSPDAKKQQDRYARFFRNRMSVAPQETIQEIMGMQNRELQTQVLSSALSEMTSFDPDGVLELLKAWVPTASAKEQDSVLSSCLWQLGRADPVGTLKFLNDLPPDNRTDSRKFDAMRAIPPGKMGEAQELLEQTKFQQDHMRKYAFREMASEIYGKNPKAALDWINRTDDRDLKAEMAEGVVQACAGKNVQEALELYLQFSQAQKLPMQAYNILNREVQMENPQVVFQWIQSNIPANERRYLASRLVDITAKSDPTQAVSLLNQITDENGRAQAGESLARQLADRPAEEAMTLIEKVEDPELQKQMRIQMLTRSAKGDFSLALQLLKNPDVVDTIQSESERYWRAESPIMTSLMNTDAEQVRAVIETLPDGPREKMLASYAGCLFGTDPRQSMDIQLSIPEQDNSALSNSFISWVDLDADSAMQWLQDNVGDDPARQNIYQTGMARWLDQDMESASVWLADYPRGDSRDRMASMLSESAGKKDPEAAFLWAVSIDNDDIRKAATIRAFSRWKESDPQAAQAALEGADLSPEEKKTFNQTASHHE